MTDFEGLRSRTAVLLLIKELERSVHQEDWKAFASIHVALAVLAREHIEEISSAYESLRVLLAMALPAVDKVFKEEGEEHSKKLIIVKDRLAQEIIFNNTLYTFGLDPKVFSVLEKFIDNPEHIVSMEIDLVGSNLYSSTENLHQPFSLIRGELKRLKLDGIMEVKRIRVGTYQLRYTTARTAEKAQLSDENWQQPEIIPESKITFTRMGFYNASDTEVMTFRNCPARFQLFKCLFNRLSQWISSSEIMEVTKLPETSLSSTRSRMMKNLNATPELKGIFQVESRSNYIGEECVSQWRLVLTPGFFFSPQNSIYKVKES